MTTTKTKDEKVDKWHLIIAYHFGTMMSRDLWDPMEFNSIEECKEKLEEIESWLRERGGYIWFAEVASPNGEKIKIHKGTPYRK